jgi:hypothetical protein
LIQELKEGQDYVPDESSYYPGNAPNAFDKPMPRPIMSVMVILCMANRIMIPAQQGSSLQSSELVWSTHTTPFASQHAPTAPRAPTEAYRMIFSLILVHARACICKT